MSKRLTQVADLDNATVLQILDTAKAIKRNPKKFNRLLKDRIVGLMFFEPSTRTYFSFASAAQRGGGNFLGFNGTSNTSMVKGESLEDTARIMSGYADILVCRHPGVGITEHLSSVINIPIINAGEGAGEHPTQTLTDFFTLREYHGRLNLKIALYGDLRFGRTTHSLIRLASRFGAEIFCVAPDAFQMPGEELAFAKQMGAKVHQLNTFTPTVLKNLDALYVTRIQKERLQPGTDMGVFDEGYVIDTKFAESLGPKTIVLHPLPRVHEISTNFEADPRAAYFTQAANGVFVRLALLNHLLS